jgi:hypothetical protein
MVMMIIIIMVIMMMMTTTTKTKDDDKFVTEQQAKFHVASLLKPFLVRRGTSNEKNLFKPFLDKAEIDGRTHFENLRGS